MLLRLMQPPQVHPPRPRRSARDRASLNHLAEHFVAGLQASLPSTVPVILRTACKLQVGAPRLVTPLRVAHMPIRPQAQHHAMAGCCRQGCHGIDSCAAFPAGQAFAWNAGDTAALPAGLCPEERCARNSRLRACAVHNLQGTSACHRQAQLRARCCSVVSQRCAEMPAVLCCVPDADTLACSVTHGSSRRP